MATRELPVSVALAALSAAVALSFGAVFTSAAFVGPLVAAALLPHALGWATRRVSTSAAGPAFVSLGGLVALAGVLAGSPSQITHQLSLGWSTILHDRVPIPATTGAVLLAA